MQLVERVKGSLYGFAIGDAMGATTEFMHPAEIQQKYGKVTSILGGGWLDLKPGQVTDDTQMMLCVYRAMKNCPEEEILSGICAEFRKWYSGYPIDVGGACRKAISTAKNNNPEDWYESSRLRQIYAHEYDLGNGGLMRCLVPCLTIDDEIACNQNKLTHNNTETILTVLQYYNKIQGILEDSFDEDKQKYALTGSYPSTGKASDTFLNAVNWFYVSESFDRAIIGAVNAGGDADTIAALTGGLVGAYFGYKAIPEAWIEQLDPAIKQELDECTNFVMARRKKNFRKKFLKST